MRWLAIAITLFAARPALAQDAPEQERSWYGYQILVLDLGAGVIASREPYAIFALPLTGPVVHLAHGSPGRALGSLALRAGLPVLGAYLGSAAAHCDSEREWFCGLGETLAMGLLGFVIAEVVDVGALGWTDGPAEPRPTAAQPRFQIAPSLGTTATGGLSAGIVGRF